MKMEPIVSSETSAIKSQTPGNYPKRNKLHLQHGESLRTRLLLISNRGHNLFIRENIHSDSSLTYKYIICRSLRFTNREVIYSLSGIGTVAFVMKKNSIIYSIIQPIIYQLIQYSRLFILWEITCSSVEALFLRLILSGFQRPLLS